MPVYSFALKCAEVNAIMDYHGWQRERLAKAGQETILS